MDRREAKRRVLSAWAQIMDDEVPDYLSESVDSDDDFDRLADAQSELANELRRRAVTCRCGEPIEHEPWCPKAPDHEAWLATSDGDSDAR